MTIDELTNLRRLFDRTTQGTWIVIPELCGPDGQAVYQQESFGPICDVSDPYPRGENHPQDNMDWIATAHNQFAALLDAAERGLA